MAPGSKKKKPKKKGLKGSPVDKLTDDTLTDIISRVPYKSTCCCKCVSTRWRDLFSHPDHRKKLPQPLAGFFRESYNKHRFPKKTRYFNNASGSEYDEPLFDPSLSFLPRYQSVDIMDCCNGLLLCRCWKVTDPKTLDYVVCNPATEKWVLVPATDWSSKVGVARLGFEPYVSSHFHVFEFIDEEDEEVWDKYALTFWDAPIKTMAIYSSKAGIWKHKSLDNFVFALHRNSKGVFVNGILHLATIDKFIVAVDVEGNDWWRIDIPMPPYDDHIPVDGIFLSQRQLYFVNSNSGSDYTDLSIWALEDHKSGKWTLKHNVSELVTGLYGVISFHPERNMIFIVYGHRNSLMSYEIDCRKLLFICHLGGDWEFQEGQTPYIPYVPLYLEPLADGP